METSELKAIKRMLSDYHQAMIGISSAELVEHIETLITALETAQANEKTWRESCERWVAKEDRLRKAIEGRREYMQNLADIAPATEKTVKLIWENRDMKRIGHLGTCEIPYCGSIDGYFCVRCRHYVVFCTCGAHCLFCACPDSAAWASNGERALIRHKLEVKPEK